MTYTALVNGGSMTNQLQQHQGSEYDNITYTASVNGGSMTNQLQRHQGSEHIH